MTTERSPPSETGGELLPGPPRRLPRAGGPANKSGVSGTGLTLRST
jgi:hypothetical protein